MNNLFKSKDYREVIKTFVQFKKENNSRYSYSYFSLAIGMSNSYLKQVVSGRRNINLAQAKLLSEKFGFDDIQSRYFLTLVLMNTSKTKELEQIFFLIS